VRVGVRGAEAVLTGQALPEQVAQQPAYVAAALADLPDHRAALVLSQDGRRPGGSQHPH
jgi:hypothetical protein